MSITSVKFIACAVLLIGGLTLGNYAAIAPAAAEVNGDGVIALEPSRAAAPELTFVALLDDEREEGDEREGRERDGDRRESAERRERDQPRREGDRPRETDQRRESDRPREIDRRRDGESGREAFRPKTENEELLYKMILQLRREVAELRNALRSRGGDVRREGVQRDQPRREGDQPRGERDQPRREGDQPRGESDKPRERDGDRPAAPREDERRDSGES